MINTGIVMTDDNTGAVMLTASVGMDPESDETRLWISMSLPDGDPDSLVDEVYTMSLSAEEAHALSKLIADNFFSDE